MPHIILMGTCKTMHQLGAVFFSVCEHFMDLVLFKVRQFHILDSFYSADFWNIAAIPFAAAIVQFCVLVCRWKFSEIQLTQMLYGCHSHDVRLLDVMTSNISTLIVGISNYCLYWLELWNVLKRCSHSAHFRFAIFSIVLSAIAIKFNFCKIHAISICKSLLHYYKSVNSNIKPMLLTWLV